MKYRFCIPSYQREDQPITVDLLNRMGYAKDEIIVGTQTLEEYREYSKRQGDKATVTYAPANNCPQNRNNLLDRFADGERILLADDDVRAFLRLTEDENRLEEIKTREELEQIFDRMFEYCERNNAYMWAWYPVENPMFMHRTIDRGNILVATLLGIRKTGEKMFNPAFSVKEDFELSLRMIASGLNVVRFNGFTCKARHMTRGGCQDDRLAGENEKCFRALVNRYPQFVRPSHRKGEIRYVGDRATEKESVLWE